MYCRHWSVVEDTAVVDVRTVAAAVADDTAVDFGTVVVDTVVFDGAAAVVVVAIHEMQERIASGDTEEEVLPPCPHCPPNPPFPPKQCAPHRAKDQA